MLSKQRTLKSNVTRSECLPRGQQGQHHKGPLSTEIKEGKQGMDLTPPNTCQRWFRCCSHPLTLPAPISTSLVQPPCLFQILKYFHTNWKESVAQAHWMPVSLTSHPSSSAPNLLSIQQVHVSAWHTWGPPVSSIGSMSTLSVKIP